MVLIFLSVSDPIFRLSLVDGAHNNNTRSNFGDDVSSFNDRSDRRRFLTSVNNFASLFTWIYPVITSNTELTEVTEIYNALLSR